MGQLPEPISTQDKFLHNIADGTPNIENIEPVSRQDKYLKYIAQNGGTGLIIEQGLWEPRLTNFGGWQPVYTLSTTNAHYYRIGNLVYITFYITGNITDAGTGYACISGIPYMSRIGTNITSINLTINGAFPEQPVIGIPSNYTYLSIYKQSGGKQSWTTGDITIGGSGCYLKNDD